MSHVIELQHPLVRHHLTQLRDQKTTPCEFRASLRRLSTLLAYEATRDLEVQDQTIKTPMTTMTGSVLNLQVALVPILRAGLGMIDPILDLIPTAEVWHMGLYRDEATAQPVKYYNKLPETQPSDVAFVIDPMLATGGSATVAVDLLKNWGVRRIKVLSIIAAREGIEAVSHRFPDTQLFVCAVDAELNAKKFIVPGLGDAGDRTFNTLRYHE